MSHDQRRAGCPPPRSGPPRRSRNLQTHFLPGVDPIRLGRGSSSACGRRWAFSGSDPPTPGRSPTGRRRRSASGIWLDPLPEAVAVSATTGPRPAMTLWPVAVIEDSRLALPTRVRFALDASAAREIRTQRFHAGDGDPALGWTGGLRGGSGRRSWRREDGAGLPVAWSATRRPGSAVDTRRGSRHAGGAERP